MIITFSLGLTAYFSIVRTFAFLMAKNTIISFAEYLIYGKSHPVKYMDKDNRSLSVESQSQTFQSRNNKASDNSLDLLDIHNRIKNGDLKIAVYGLGHVGSPIASVWLRAGAHVIGVDKSSRVIDNAKKGTTHIPEPGVSDAFSEGLDKKKFYVYEDLVKASQDSFFKMICVPVLSADGSADLAAVREVAAAIGKGLKRGDVVSLNPSVPPGTTEDVVLPILQKESSLEVEKDFYLLYNPERIYEGRAIEDIEERYPGIVSGAGLKSLQIGSSLLSLIFKKGIIQMSSIKTAETEKLLEGVYRDVNIALANELAKFCEQIGVDFWEARDAANSQPFCHIHKPGAGVGGACIPVYPQFILHTADRLNINCDVTRLGRIVNDSMPVYCVNKALELLNIANDNSDEKKIDSITVTLLGLAFRGNVSDTRLSPTYKIVEELNRIGIKQIKIHDPLVRKDSSLPSTVVLTSELSVALEHSDLVILVADHSEYRKLTPLEIGNIPIYDGRGIIDISAFKGRNFGSIGRAENQES